MIIVLQNCFGGGFIDDLDNLSRGNRITLTATTETLPAVGDGERIGGDFDYLSEFSAALMDAIHGYNTTYDPYEYRIVDVNPVSVSDLDRDGVISWREAYIYAKNNDPWDTPWFDGNNNGRPTYKDEREYLEYSLFISHYPGGYTDPSAGGHEYDAGTVVVANAIPNSGYRFGLWYDDEGWTTYTNPYYQLMDRDHTLRAYFEIEGGGGGGDGCPKLYTWNGVDYVDYGVIDIHNPSGQDIVKEVLISKQDLAVEGFFKAKLRLQEGWEGLNYSHSEIDQVKLYAVFGRERFSCPLTNATYINQYNVWVYLIASDDNKCDIYLLETIDLEFSVPYKNIQSFTFTIEGCNQYKN